MRARVSKITARRNRIAHTADRGPDIPRARAAITASEAHAAIDWLTLTTEAIAIVLGKPPSPPVQETPEGVDTSPEAEAAAEIATKCTGPGAWDEQSLLRQIEKTSTAEVTDLLVAMYRHAQGHPAFRHFFPGEGKHPSVTAWFKLGEDEAAAVWSIYTDEQKSVLAINFQWMRDRTALAKRLAPLANALSSLPELQDLPRDLAARN